MINLLEKIQNVLQAEDIEGLIAIGAPDDEYSDEANEIAMSLEGRNISEASVTPVIMEVWKKYFGPFSDEEFEKRIPALNEAVKKIAG